MTFYPWYAGGALALALHVALLFFWSAWRAGVVAAALLAVIVLVCTGAGRLVLRAFGTAELSESEKTLIGCTLGLGLLATGMFLLGVFGLMRPWAVGALVAGLWVAGFTEMRDVVLSLGANRNLLRDRPLWAAGILALLGLTFWASFAPPHQYDALVYHLPLPAAYLRAGAIRPVGHLLFSHFPQNGEMLFALALSLHSDVLAQMFSWLASVLSVLWVFEMGKREMPLPAALTACLLLASHTGVMLLSSIAYVEPLVMLWVTASVLCWLRWREVESGETKSSGWLALSAVFAGLGVGTKYYAGICPAVLALMLLPRRRELALYSSIAAAAASPWLLKNLLFTGNPVFPFLYAQLPHHGIPWAAETARRYFEILTEYGHGGHLLRDLLQFPYLAASGSLRFGGGMDVLGDLGWAPILAAAPAAVLAAWRNRALRRLGLYCALHWAAWFSTGVVLRFLTVIAPLLSLLAAAGLYRVWTELGERGRRALALACGLFLAVNLLLFGYVHAVFQDWNVLLGVETREEFLARRLDYYPCARAARERLGGNDRMLVVGEQRGYFLEQDHVTTTPMAPNAFVALADRAGTPEELAGLLKKEGFTFVIVVPREARRLADYGVFAFSERGRRNWTGFEQSRLERVYPPDGTQAACALLRIR